MATSAPPAQSRGQLDKGLKLGALGLISSIVFGVASTAPGYSLAATIGYIGQEVGTRAPIIVLLAFIPMLFISYAYKALNNADPDCGTTFTWVARAFDKRRPDQRLGDRGGRHHRHGRVREDRDRLVRQRSAPAYFRGETMRERIAIGEQGQVIGTESLD